MASSLDERCNADKHRYDTCFNHWLKSYLVLVAPPIDAPLDTVQGQRAREQRLAEIEKSKKELDAKCGSLYEAYQSCVWKGIREKDGLLGMLDEARREEPLHTWDHIKTCIDILTN